MPLIKCNECDKEISDSAETCPHCGAETQLSIDKKAKKQVHKSTIIKIVAVIALLLVARIAYVEYQDYQWRESGGPEAMRELQKSLRDFERSSREFERSLGR